MATLTANSVSRAATRSVPEWPASATNASEPVTRPVTSLTVTRTTAAATLSRAARRRARASRWSSVVRSMAGAGVASPPLPTEVSRLLPTGASTAGPSRGSSLPRPPSESSAVTLTARRSRGRPPNRRRSRSPPAPSGAPRPAPSGVASPQQTRQGAARPRRLLRLQQPRTELPRGAATVADRVLLLGGQLRHRPVARVVVGDEGRVVAEAPRPSGLVGEPPLTAAVHYLFPPSGLHT